MLRAVHRQTMLYIFAALSFGFSFSIYGCSSGYIKRLFSNSENGVPLSEFTASHGNYFPSFISKFFRSASQFSKDYPSLAQARSGMLLVEVKQLSSDNAAYNETNLSWSADGVYLAFEAVTDRYSKILLKDLVGDFAHELLLLPKGTNNFLDGMVVRSAHSYNAGLRWSRDSTRFAFMSNGGIGEYNIYIGAVGAKEKPVTRSPTKDGYATWSPGTNEIAFVSGRTGSGDIYLVDLENRGLTRLSTSPDVDLFPEWTPDAKTIVYASGDALNHNLFVIEREHKTASWQKPRPLTDSPSDDLRPTISPDGRYVAFYADSDSANKSESRSWNIYVVPLKTARPYTASNIRKMCVAKDVVIDLNTGPAWTPDSRKIFYVKKDPANFNPIFGYDLFSGERYLFRTRTRMNRDILMSRIGVLSFRAQVGVWDRVFVALTNQGTQLQNESHLPTKIHYEAF